MRRRPRGCRRSVDRGTRRPGYRAAKFGIRGAQVVLNTEGNTGGVAIHKTPQGPARSKNHGMYGTSVRENREVPRSLDRLIPGGPLREGQGHNPEMDDRGNSDNPVAPARPPNKAGEPVAEVVEERGLAKGNTDRPTRPGRRAGPDVPHGLDRVREAAARDSGARFTALLHHVTVDRLQKAYRAIRPQAAPGVDGVRWTAYGQDLEANLADLHRRLHSGAYRPSPSRRSYIPKADGRQRPLGIATLEDKIVQRAVVEVLNAIYEVDFCGFPYGFRPGRKPHDALDALAVGIERKRVNWVLDADIRDFFGQLDHASVEKFFGHRIADKRVLRLIAKWLKAGVIEDGEWQAVDEGAPQGASVSPLIANVYLHYVLDRWARRWRSEQAHGDMIIVRWADDFVAGFEHRDDAERFLTDLRERFSKFGLELHPEKTRLIEFGASWFEPTFLD